jgi:putative Mg2+ transporter-C (MgtC) family protein
MDLLAVIGFENTHTPAHIILVRLLIAAVLGGLIGIERGKDVGSAGLRTLMLISLAAALFTTLAFEIYRTALAGGSNNPDPIRTIEAVTAGVAFMGAGAIFQQRGSIHGLTTGAGMWLAGAVGVTTALGYYLIAAAVAVFALAVLALLRTFSHKFVNREPEERENGTGGHGPR